MPAALTLFTGLGRWPLACDLTGATQINFKVYVGGTAGFAGSKLLLRYRTFAAGNSSTASDWNVLGTTEVACPISGGTVSFFESGWIEIVAGAKGSVLLAVLGIDGNGAISPIILSAFADIKSIP